MNFDFIPIQVIVEFAFGIDLEIEMGRDGDKGRDSGRWVGFWVGRLRSR